MDEEYKEGLAQAVLVVTALILAVFGCVLLSVWHPLWLAALLLIGWVAAIVASIVYLVRKKTG